MRLFQLCSAPMQVRHEGLRVASTSSPIVLPLPRPRSMCLQYAHTLTQHARTTPTSAAPCYLRTARSGDVADACSRLRGVQA